MRNKFIYHITKGIFRTKAPWKSISCVHHKFYTLFQSPLKLTVQMKFLSRTDNTHFFFQSSQLERDYSGHLILEMFGNKRRKNNLTAKYLVLFVPKEVIELAICGWKWTRPVWKCSLKMLWLALPFVNSIS